MPSSRRPRRHSTPTPRVRFRPRLTLLEDRAVPSTVTEVETNDTIATANNFPVPLGDILATPLSDWLTVNGTVATDTDLDFFKVTVTRNVGLFVEARAQALDRNEDLDTGLAILRHADAGYDTALEARERTHLGLRLFQDL